MKTLAELREEVSRSTAEIGKQYAADSEKHHQKVVNAIASHKTFDGGSEIRNPIVVAEKKKRKKPVSATQKSLKWLRDQGYTAWVVEQNVHFFNKETHRMEMFKRDAWNIADIIAIRSGDSGTLYVQTTTTGHGADRVAKIRANPIASLLLTTGNRIHVHGWAKRGARGAQKLWTLKIYDLATDTEVVEEQEDPASPTLFSAVKDEYDEQW
jgi:hypothetical protein